MKKMLILLVCFFTNEINTFSQPKNPFLFRRHHIQKLKQKEQQLKNTNTPISNALTNSAKEVKEPSIEVKNIADIDSISYLKKVNTPTNKTFVVIIANEDYQQVSPVVFAKNDGRIFKKYCEQLLNIPNKNILYYENATFGQMRQALNTLQKRLEVFSKEYKVIFYYAGHGFPDEKNKSTYLLPVDGDFTDEETTLSLQVLYDKLSALPSQQVMLFLDACFSGVDRNGSGLFANRAVGIKPKKNKANKNLIVFSASQNDETAFPYKEQYHGLFSYFLMKALKETNGEINLENLYTYINDNVKKTSILTNNKLQTPQVDIGENLENDWKNLNFK